MSYLKVIKETSNLLSEEGSLGEQEADPGQIYIITDSKGKYIKPVIPGRLRSKINIFYKSGANINSEIIDEAIQKIKHEHYPIVLIWLGTCEITTKTGKFCTLSKYPYQQVEEILTQYREAKDKIKHSNRNANIYFMECPYYSILTWNKSQGKKYSSNEEREVQKLDNELKSVVNYFNQQLMLINREHIVPRISQDQIIASKRKRSRRTKYRVNYRLLYDGIHPKRILARLWIHRFVKLARKIRQNI